jgi:signal transduction histidine kinase
MLAFGVFLLLSSASSLVFVFRLFDRYASIVEDHSVPDAISAAVQALRESDKSVSERLERVTADVLSIQRSYGRFGIEKKQLMIETLAAFLLFLLVQVGLLFALSYLVATLLTRPLSAIRTGLERIERGENGYRFPALRGREMGMVGSRLNHFLDLIREKEGLLAEQSRLLGWQEVLSFLAHQIKNPLSAISLSAKNVDLALERGSKSAVVEDSLSILSRESRRVSELITRFRETVRFPELSLAVTDMAALIAEAASAMPADRVGFSLDLAPGPPLNLDRGLVKEALSNLFTNSMEASEGETKIDVRLRWDGPACCITVDDDVRGVPEETARSVLSAVFSTKPGGSGLGLLFVRKVVAMHGGIVNARHAEDGGLVFEIRLKGGNVEWRGY